MSHIQAPKESDLASIIKALELSLLEPSVRHTAPELEKLLADDFIELGSSGTIYNKKEILAQLPLEKSRKFIVEDFGISILTPEIVLATYKIRENDSYSLRSSIWKKEGKNWRIRFHQGTKIIS